MDTFLSVIVCSFRLENVNSELFLSSNLVIVLLILYYSDLLICEIWQEINLNKHNLNISQQHFNLKCTLSAKSACDSDNICF